jgi:hypothetical protein
MASRRHFLSQVAMLCLPACARGQQGAARGARTRILYSDRAASRDLAVLPHQELGTVDGAAWVACPDETVQTLAEKRAPVFLYFNRHDYDAAMAGLGPALVQEVIRHRREDWAPQAKGYVLSLLFEGERVALEGALGQAAGKPGRAPVERTLRLLQRMAGLSRYESMPAKAMAVTVLEGESLLLATVKSALEARTGTLEDQRLLSIHRGRLQVWTGIVARAAVALGAKEFENTLPFADPSRAVFVHPVDQALERTLAGASEPPARWRDGLVFVATERRLDELRRRKLSIDLLYADAGEFYDGIETLTHAQLHRDFATRLGRTREAERLDVLGHIDRLHLHQVLMKRELRARPDAAQACERAGFAAMIQEDIGLLGDSLARTRTFSRSRGMAAMAPAALYGTAESTVAADLSLFGKIAARHWPGILKSLQELETLLRIG